MNRFIENMLFFIITWCLQNCKYDFLFSFEKKGEDVLYSLEDRLRGLGDRKYVKKGF